MAGIALLFTAWLRYRNIQSERPQDKLPFINCGWMQYTLVWMLYLFMYETGMRGILMPWQTGPALVWLASNSLFYTLVHLHRGRRETLGALLFGLVLGFVTLQVYSLWPALAAHMVISIQMDIRPTFKKLVRG
jgi:membrane protease YdiL (CAAX protease family)